MWKIFVGLAVGVGIGFFVSMCWRTGFVPSEITNNAKLPPTQPQIKIPTDSANATSDAIKDSLEPDEYNHLQVVYEGHGVLVIERMHHQNRLLVVLQNRVFEIGPVWDFESQTEIQLLDGGGELFTAVFKKGAGTGVSSHDALVILSRQGHIPAVAQLWHHGYSLDRQQISHDANTVGYEIQGNTLLTHFEYGGDGQAIQTYTDVIEFIPGELIVHGSEKMLAHVFAMPSEDGDPTSSLPFSYHNRTIASHESTD